MASHGWRTDRPLTLDLAEESARFDFYQLVRLLLIERGLDSDQIEQGVRFQADLGQGFPAHEVSALRTGPKTDTGKPPMAVVETQNYALAGYLGPLPEALTEQLLDRRREGDAVWSRFLDIFNNRLNTVRYQLKSARRLALNLVPPEKTSVANMLLSLIGLAEPEQRRQLPLPTRSVLGLAGLLADRRRSTPVLTRVLSRFTGASITVDSLAGIWRTFQTDKRTRLGKSGNAQTLGQLCRLGGQAWLPASAVRLVVGPVPFSTYRRLLPKRQSAGDDIYPLFSWLVRFLLDRRQDAWVVLRLMAGDAPPSRLNTQGRDGNGQSEHYGLRLGQTAWLNGNADVERQATFLVRAFDGVAA